MMETKHYLRLVCTLLLIVPLLAYVPELTAQQYRSRELKGPVDTSGNKKSIAELEAGLKDVGDDYAKASTARFLARHYAQNKQLNKAEEYYRQSLEGEGLSVYAKQQALTELAGVLALQKDWKGLSQVLAEYETAGGKLDADLYLLQAMSNHHAGNRQAAITAADKVLALQPKPEEEFLNQLLFIYYQNGAYRKAAKMQHLLVALAPASVDRWRQLAAIHLKAKDYSRAASALEAAHQEGLALSLKDLNQLINLYALSKNPLAAARLKQRLIDEESVKPTVDNLENLFALWMQARELDKAIAALQQANTVSDSVERRLQIARLQMQATQWQAMQDTLMQACKRPLDDAYVGRANLLMGISALKLDQTDEARRYFINATFVGGENDKAAAYLDYMQAEPATTEEESAFFGQCKPRWEPTPRRMVVAAPQLGRTEDNAEAADSAELVDFKIQTSQPQTLYLANYSLKFTELESKLLPLAMQLGTSAVKNGGKISGPMHFIFPKAYQPGDVKMDFQMAFPVSKKPRRNGRYKVLEDKGFKAANWVYRGDPKKIMEGWVKLYMAVIAKGHTVTGVSRQLVLEPEKASKDQVTLQLQLGVE